MCVKRREEPEGECGLQSAGSIRKVGVRVVIRKGRVNDSACSGTRHSHL